METNHQLGGLPIVLRKTDKAHTDIRSRCVFRDCPPTKEYNVQKGLLNHIVRDRLGKELVRCTFCVRLFPSTRCGYYAYRDHLRLFHSGKGLEEMKAGKVTAWPFLHNESRGEHCPQGVPRNSKEDLVVFVRELSC